MRKLIILLPLALASLLVRAVGAGELSHEQAVAGRKLYVTKCARCHQFYDPKAYDEAKWKHWMEKMRAKAKLTDDQYKLLTVYLDSVRVKSSK